jgi:L-lactate dehydrogenase complex protein LldG
MPDPMIEKIRKALGRSQPLKIPPTPPQIPDAIARLAPKDANLVQLFEKSAVEAHFHFQRATTETLCPQIVEFLQLHQCKNIAISVSPLLDRLGIASAIRAASIAIHSWNEQTLDSAYDLDCGITDVHAAIAETGSLVIRSDPTQGRALSLVPSIHIAIVEPPNILPDLLDLMQKLSAEPRPPNITLITGPSKTADIEGALVTGVHGPGLVQIFLLQSARS